MEHLLSLAAKTPNHNADGSMSPEAFRIHEGLVYLGPYSRAIGKTTALIRFARELAKVYSRDKFDVLVVFPSTRMQNLYRDAVVGAGARPETPASFAAFVEYAEESERCLIVLADEVSRESLGEAWTHPNITWKAGWGPRGPMAGFTEPAPARQDGVADYFLPYATDPLGVVHKRDRKTGDVFCGFDKFEYTSGMGKTTCHTCIRKGGF